MMATPGLYIDVSNELHSISELESELILSDRLGEVGSSQRDSSHAIRFTLYKLSKKDEEDQMLKTKLEQFYINVKKS